MKTYKVTWEWQKMVRTSLFVTYIEDIRNGLPTDAMIHSIEEI